jgi:hypothetical protein
MNIRAVDPTRDRRWFAPPSGYRVRFFTLLSSRTPSSPEVGVPVETEEFELTDAKDVTEALDWANSDAAGRTYTLAAVHDRGTDQGLIHLFGVDPTVSTVSFEPERTH